MLNIKQSGPPNEKIKNTTIFSEEEGKVKVQFSHTNITRTKKYLSEKLDFVFSSNLEHELFHSFWAAKLTNIGLYPFAQNSIAFEAMLGILTEEEEYTNIDAIEHITYLPSQPLEEYLERLAKQYEQLIKLLKFELLKTDPRLITELKILNKFSGKTISPQLMKLIQPIAISLQGDTSLKIQKKITQIIYKINTIGLELNKLYEVNDNMKS
jgi:hypothetical protein